MLVTVVLRRLGGLRAPGFGAWGGRGEAAAGRWAGRPPEDPPCRERSCVVTSAPLQPRSAPLSEMPGAELCGKPRTEVFPSPKGSTTNNTVFEAPKFTSFIPVALGWVSLPETGEASPMLPCSKWAVQGPWHHCPSVLSTLGAALPGTYQDSSGCKSRTTRRNCCPHVVPTARMPLAT